MSAFYDDSMPMGLAMGLGMNLNAMDHYSDLTEAQKEEILNRARDAKSKEEMEKIISQISDDEIF